ncbi:MAG TPA: ferritin-like domain-containing protein [Chthoniobacterales bacterium]|jgi:rubrerythrin
MNSQYWLRYYEQNRKDRLEPKWNSPSPLDSTIQQVLVRSLSHFQLGETGGGTFLIDHACKKTASDECYLEALQFFIAEESEHARLLERLVLRFGGATIRQHWTHALFRLVRHTLGFQFEIQVLVIAELVGTAYYRLLRARTRDSVLDETCALLLRDEAQHVEFHAQWLGQGLSRLLPLEVGAWRTQFQALFTAATTVAWIDHREALIASGSNRREFFREARQECIRFLHKVQVNANEQIALLVTA